ncbi:heme A synthase [Anaerobacillus sp. CMMVII]|nr:heme A synthase [Anaerobacillus sp. CMMVII]
MNKNLKIFSILTTIGMIIVLLQGALVTKTESGQGCGDSWPLCHGQVIPESITTLETIIEYSHRFVSGILGIMVIILAIWMWRKLPHVRETKFLAIIAVLFIIFQGLLGAAAVMWGQSSAVLALHFGFSLVSFASVLLLTILVFEEGKPSRVSATKITTQFRSFIYFVFTYLYIVVYTGALVRHTDSSLACAGWPLCNGQIIPPLRGNIAVQFGHRVAAAVMFLVILALLVHVYRHYKEEIALRYTVLISFILVTIQVLSGAYVVFTAMSLFSSMLHAFIITCLFGSISYLLMLATRSKS